MNVAHFLTATATRVPDHPAVHFGGETLTYQEMNCSVDALAHGLAALGLNPGDICMLMMPSSLNWALVYYALAKVGAVVVPINFLYRHKELAYIFQDAQPKAFIGHSDYLQEPMNVMGSTQDLKIRIASGDHLPKGFIPLGDMFHSEETFAVYPTNPEDPFTIIYTSGTTGEPKGAVLTHKALMSDAKAVASVRHTEPHDVVLSVLPLFHIYGMTHALNISVYLGLTIRMWSAFDEDAVLSAIESEESTILYAVPTMVNRLVEASFARPPKRSGLRFVISGGASLPVEILHRFEEAFGAPIHESYGLTEFSPTCVENPFGRPTRPGSIGLPIPPFQARIVDQEDRDVPTGTVGELIVSGPAMMKEYLNKQEATREALRNGWLHTGDLARMDEDGYIYIVDRKKDMIIRGGYNVYPREVEEVLYTHPAVSEGAVVGVPHQDLGEEIAAAIVLKPGSKVTQDELRQFVKQEVAPYKYPRIIKFFEELPKTAAGKIQKRSISFEE
ncbi:MAG: long-chain fatty acid--CoA ligase [Deltaproteobacteria bacterium]|nr:long-chain fatty acid--CoA ligase [Deltaproteobacteria bacterium]